jgi:hypothetical protein
VREIRQGDVDILFDVEGQGLSGSGVADLMHQWRLLEAGLKTCYVAVTPESRLCFMAWLLTPSANQVIREYFQGAVAPLGDGETLIEGVLTLEQYRGRHVMQAAVAKLREMAGTSGARWMNAYVSEENVVSLRGFSRVGFEPFLLRTERWRFGRRQVRFDNTCIGTH